MGNGYIVSSDRQGEHLATMLSERERELILNLRSMQDVPRGTIECAARTAAAAFPKRATLRLVIAAARRR